MNLSGENLGSYIRFAIKQIVYEEEHFFRTWSLLS